MVQTFRYKAFISYSHADRRLAEWLHKSIETYRLPRALVGRTTDVGRVPARLTPVFRDREELPAAGELNVALYDALRQSEFLIVIASPASAQSRWVNEEVRFFKQNNGESRVLVVIADGVPLANCAEECFVPALRHQVSTSGQLLERQAEPLAADLRADGDGKRLGKLKVIAGLAGLTLNELVQRETARKQRTLLGYTTAATVLAVTMAALAVMAVRGQIEADRQRAESDGLVEFMLTDLREQLEPVGRLEIFDSVGQRALAYFSSQDIASLDADSLGRRARALHLVGEVRNLQADSDGALDAFERAQRTTEELLARDPMNVRRIYDHSQSTFWVGYVAWQRNEIEAAERRFREYGELADQLVALEPENEDWQAEKSSSLVNLGVLLHYEGRDEEALSYFRRSMAIDQRLLRVTPDDQEKRWGVAQGHAWLSDAMKGMGDFEGAMAQRDEELALYSAMLEQDEQDARALEGSVASLLQIADLALLSGRYASALESARLALDQVMSLVDEDASNAFWQDLAVSAHNRTVEALMLLGDWAAARALNQTALQRARVMVEADPTVTSRITNGVMNARWMEIAILAASVDRSAAGKRLLEFERDFGLNPALSAQDAVVPWSMVHAMTAVNRRAEDDLEAAAEQVELIKALSPKGPRVIALLEYLDGIASDNPWPGTRVVPADSPGYDPALILK